MRKVWMGLRGDPDMFSPPKLRSRHLWAWADMHAAYRAAMSNAKALLDAAYGGDMTTAEARYAETGTLTDSFTRAQEAVALDCR